MTWGWVINDPCHCPNLCWQHTDSWLVCFVCPLLSLRSCQMGFVCGILGRGQQHTLLLADGDCIQPILYYSGQQVKEVMEQTEDEEQTGEYTQQPVLLPFLYECEQAFCIIIIIIIISDFSCIINITQSLLDNVEYYCALNPVHWCCIILWLLMTLFILCVCVFMCLW